MAAEQPAIVGDSFAVGYRFQHYWDVSMATAFFFGELGGGLFIISLFYDVVPGLIAGMVASGIVKPYFHLTHMGVPFNSWRSIMRPDRAWISRGLLSIGAMVVLGILYLLTQFGGAPVSIGDGLLQGIKVVMVLAALMVIAYHGFAMSHSSAIALWSTGLMPVASIAYALAAGAAVTAAVVANLPNAGAAESMPSLQTLSLILIAGAAIVLVSLISAALNGSPGARVSANLLLRGTFARLFVPLTLVVGIVVPVLMLLFLPATSVTTLVVAVAFVVGYFTFRVLMFKAGVYEPIMDFAPDVAGIRR